MKRFILLATLFCLVLIASPASAGDYDWKADFQRDLVTVEDGKMTYSELELCEVKGKSKSFQLQWNAEAPAEGVITRDQFVRFITVFNMAFVAEMAESQGITLSGFFDKVDCNPADEPIGNVDATITLVLSKGGFQMQVKAAGKESKQMTSTWEQVFDD